MAAPPPPVLNEEDEMKVPLTNNLEEKIAEAFKIFDIENNNMCEVRVISTILRGLGLCPTEGDIQEIIKEVEHPRILGSVHLRHFLPVAVRVITEHKFEPTGPAELLEAFRKLDTLGKGYFTKEQFYDFMTKYGEPFTQDEIDEMMETAIDPLSKNVDYEYYVNQLLYYPPPDNVYVLADIIEAEKAAIQAAIEAKRRFFLGGGI